MLYGQMGEKLKILVCFIGTAATLVDKEKLTY